ncbi:MAG TPA: VWA domain-containing protein [Blastocatellia bacterium]|jgi:Ca-activated chloride channel family protein
MKRALSICVAALIATSLVVAQTLHKTKQRRQTTSIEQEDDETISFDTALVNTRVSVRDGQGRFVSGLTKSDFIVVDDGKEQPIIYFSQESDEPLRVALVVDRSRSVQGVLGRARTVVRDFIHSILRPGKDSACLVAFDSGVYLVQDFTEDADTLAAAVNKLTAAGGTSIFDAVYKTARDKLAGTEEARRVLLLISDGDDTTSRASIEQAIEVTVRNNVVVYAIRLPGENSLNGRDQQGKPVLARLTETTGGAQFQLSDARDGEEKQLAGFFNKLEDELRSQYSIGYQFQAVSSGSSFHKITVKLKQPALKAFTRSGYYSGSQ